MIHYFRKECYFSYGQQALYSPVTDILVTGTSIRLLQIVYMYQAPVTDSMVTGTIFACYIYETFEIFF